MIFSRGVCGLLLLFPILGESTYSHKLTVVTSTTDLAWSTKVIGGEHIEVSSLLDGTENPHFVDAIPAFIQKVAEASVVCIVGLELEVGWMPKILSRSGNAEVQPGGKGYCEVGTLVSLLERPTGPVNRSMGDVHPAGNPHFWLSPKALAEGGQSIRTVLMRVDPPHASAYEQNYRSLVGMLDSIQAKQNARLLAIFGKDKVLVMEYHKEFTYFLDAYGIASFGSLEEKPGVPPSAGRIAEVALAAKAAGVRALIASQSAPKKTLEKFSELSGIPYAQLPTSIQPPKIKDYVALQEFLINTIITRVQTTGAKNQTR